MIIYNIIYVYNIIYYVYKNLILGVSWFLITLHAAFYNIDSVLCPGEDELNSLVMQEV